MAGVEAEKPSLSGQAPDLDRQDADATTASGSGFAEERVAELRVANLQGANREIVRLAIQAPIEGRLQEVEFDFNLDLDRPRQVRFARGACK